MRCEEKSHWGGFGGMGQVNQLPNDLLMPQMHAIEDAHCDGNALAGKLVDGLGEGEHGFEGIFARDGARASPYLPPLMRQKESILELVERPASYCFNGVGVGDIEFSTGGSAEGSHDGAAA